MFYVYTSLKDAHRSYHYPFPGLGEVFTQVSGGRIFSKIDLENRRICRLKWTTNVQNYLR